jgi:murein tripeptide amidase MpaA
MRNLTLAALAAVLMTSTSMAPDISAKAPWDQTFLPPAPQWQGASQALIRDKSDPWVTAFEADPEHDFSPNYVDTRKWFDRLDAASDLIRIEQFGVSPQGRPIYAVIASARTAPRSIPRSRCCWPRPASIPARSTARTPA